MLDSPSLTFGLVAFVSVGESAWNCIQELENPAFGGCHDAAFVELVPGSGNESRFGRGCEEAPLGFDLFRRRRMGVDGDAIDKFQRLSGGEIEGLIEHEGRTEIGHLGAFTQIPGRRMAKISGMIEHADAGLWP